MTHEEMITAIIERYGFEHHVTIAFCDQVEITEERNNHWVCESYLLGVFNSFMTKDYN